MAQKKVVTQIKLQVEAGKANPAPPVGPALGQHGLNIMEFCKQFNEKSKNQVGIKLPVVITVYADRSFTFITKSPPAPLLIKKRNGHQERISHCRENQSRVDQTVPVGKDRRDQDERS